MTDSPSFYFSWADMGWLMAFWDIASGLNTSSQKAYGRIAYAIGLHRELRDNGNQNFIEIEERRRLFWALFSLDATLSLVMGRPPLISDLDIDVELPQSIDDEKITSEEILPDEIDEEHEDYIHDHLKTLSLRFRKIYENLYSVKACKGRLRSELALAIQNSENELRTWRATVPPEYAPFLSGENPVSFASALSLRTFFSVAHYYSLCLIRRPALFELTRSVSKTESGEETLRSDLPESEAPDSPNRIAENSAIAARDLVNLIVNAPLQGCGQFPYLPLRLHSNDVQCIASVYPDSGLDHYR